jgi:hypothetical protein
MDIERWMIVLAWRSGRLELTGMAKIGSLQLKVVSLNSSRVLDLVWTVRMNIEKRRFFSRSPL